MTKQERHEAIRERCHAAIRDLYHNATPDYPRADDDREADEIQDWFQSAAEFEIEYIADGGAYGNNYSRTLRHNANAGRYHSEAAREYFVRKGMREMREDRERNAWEYISEYGKLYTWGRGGRTLAPNDLVSQRGGSSFSLREDACDKCLIADCVHMLRIVESFNRYVTDWCASVPEQWREEKAMRNEQRIDDAESFAERD